MWYSLRCHHPPKAVSFGSSKYPLLVGFILATVDYFRFYPRDRFITFALNGMMMGNAYIRYELPPTSSSDNRPQTMYIRQYSVPAIYRSEKPRPPKIQRKNKYIAWCFPYFKKNLVFYAFESASGSASRLANHCGQTRAKRGEGNKLSGCVLYESFNATSA